MSDIPINCYEKNFLTNVIFRVDFPPIFELNDNNPPFKLQEKIADEFPFSNQIKGEELEINIEEAQTTKSEKIAWEFMNRTKTTKVIIDSEFIIIECNNYETFRAFYDSVELILNEFIKLYPVKIATRLGLRYINQIHLEEPNPLDCKI